MTRPVLRLDRASEIVLVLLIAGTPLAFGSVEVWAREAMKAGILLFVVLRLAHRWAARGGERLGAGFRGTGLLVPAALFVALVLLQAAPLPSGAIRLLSPRADEIYRQVLPGYPGATDLSRVEGHLLGEDAAAPMAIAGEGVEPPPPRALRTLSLSPAATLERLDLLVAYLLLFFAVVEFARDPDRRVRILMTVTLTGFGIAALAVVQRLTWNGKILWLRPAPSATRPLGPFINPNHFTGYMELILPVAVGLLLLVWRMRAAPVPRFRRAEENPAGVVRFPRLDEMARPNPFAGWGEAAVAKTVLIAGAMAVSVFAILTSGSRGGLIASALAFGLFAWLLFPPTFRRRALLASGLAALALSAAVVLASYGVGPLTQPMTSLVDVGAEPSFAMRWMTWGRVLEMVRDFPLLGTGLGTFERAYEAYYPAGVYQVWTHAHNDYLQIAAETGLLGFALLLLGLIRYARRVFVPALAPGPEREIRLGVAIALVSMGLHSMVDFNMQIPSNGMLTVLLAGLLSAAAVRDRAAEAVEALRDAA